MRPVYPYLTLPKTLKYIPKDKEQKSDLDERGTPPLVFLEILAQLCFPETPSIVHNVFHRNRDLSIFSSLSQELALCKKPCYF